MQNLKTKTNDYRWLRWFLLSRFKYLRYWASRFFDPKSAIFTPSNSSVRILIGGDVSFDQEIRNLPYLGAYRLEEQAPKHRILSIIKRKIGTGFHKLLLSSRFDSRQITAAFPEILVKNPENKKKQGYLTGYYKKTIPIEINNSTNPSRFYFPFEKIAPFMKKKDIVFVNLETPLSSHPRVRGFFNSDPNYAQAMKEAGIKIVSLANNHIFDAGEIGFLQTIVHLKDAGISYTGAGMNLEDARLGKLIQSNGMNYMFLSYTQFCIHRYTSIAAEYPGVLPMDRQLMLEDVQAAIKKADFVFVSLHWGFENQPNVHPKQIEIAHMLVDAGADGILGHHPHVAHGIEIYKKRPIFYSLSNFIFGQSITDWWPLDNYLAEIIIDRKSIKGVMIYPISGKGKDLFQPELLTGDRADSVLYEMKIKSGVFNTGIAMKNHKGYIKVW
ncbi:MAG: CapA family protein [Planctomycetota bacterium]